MAIVTETLTAHPSSYDSTHYAWASTNTSYPISNGYTDSSSTTYARINLVTGSQAESYIYYKFDFSDIPDGATITAVNASGKANVSTTNTTRVATKNMQLATGFSSNITLKGSATSMPSTAASTSIDTVGSWTVSEVKDAGIRFYAKRGTGSTSSTYYFRIYGATMSVTYQYNEVTYTITTSITGSGSISPSGQTEVAQGDSFVLTINAHNPQATDNNVNVTSQLVQVTGGTDVLVPNDSTNTGFTIDDVTKAYTDISSSTYADCSLAGRTTGTLYLDLSDLTIPSGSTILSTSCQASLQISRNGSSSSMTAECQMYSGTTAKGSATTLVSSATDVARTTYTLNIGSWTESEINNARFYVTMYNGASSTVRHIYVYGISFSVTYEVDGEVYTYTISNVSSAHTIVVTVSEVTTTLYFKDNGAWVAATQVYKKVSGSWVLQTTLSNVFDSSTNYLKG